MERSSPRCHRPGRPRDPHVGRCAREPCNGSLPCSGRCLDRRGAPTPAARFRSFLRMFFLCLIWSCVFPFYWLLGCCLLWWYRLICQKTFTVPWFSLIVLDFQNCQMLSSNYIVRLQLPGVFTSVEVSCFFLGRFRESIVANGVLGMVRFKCEELSLLWTYWLLFCINDASASRMKVNLSFLRNIHRTSRQATRGTVFRFHNSGAVKATSQGSGYGWQTTSGLGTHDAL